MVKYITFFIIFGQLLFFYCHGQENPKVEGISLFASFDTNIVSVGDSLKLKLHFTNNTNTTYTLYPKAIIGLARDLQAFIFYDPNRVVYKLNSFCDYDSIVYIKPGEKFIYEFDLEVDSNFFFIGENTVKVYYYIFDELTNEKKRRHTKRKPIISLDSQPIKIEVNYKKK